VLLHPGADLGAEAVAAAAGTAAELDVVQLAALHQLLELVERHRLVDAVNAFAESDTASSHVGPPRCFSR
jgi:hypothetical protein